MIRWLKNIRWKVVLYSMLAVAVCCAMVLLMSFISLKSSEQACVDLKVIVSGSETFIDQRDILEMVQQKHGELVGRTMETLPFHAIEADLKAVPYVASAIVSNDMNGHVVISIRQRQAVLRVINNAGKDFYIDDKGLKMPVSLKYTPRVPIINGHIHEPYNEALDTVRSVLMQDAFKVAAYISADSVWSNQIVQLYVNVQGDIELVPRVGTQQIILGNAADLDKKFQKLKLFYTKIVPRVGMEAYKTVNLKYAGQLVCERSEHFDPTLFQQPDAFDAEALSTGAG